MDTTDLRGFTVGVTADRRSGEQAVMLERLGVDVVHGTTIQTLPIVGDDHLREVTEALITEPPDVVIANTALGIRSWLELAFSWELAPGLLAALGSATIVCRGSKSAGAIHGLGLSFAWKSPVETLADVTDHLLGEGVGGLRIAFQLHGDDEHTVTRRLEAAGAEVIELPIYRWTLPDDDGPTQRLIGLCCSGGMDAVTFTAGPAVRNLFAIAERTGQSGELRTAFNTRVMAVCMGPVCAESAVRVGIVDPIVPPHHRLGSLVRSVGRELGDRRRVLRVGEVVVRAQGTTLFIGDEAVELTDRERRVFDLLAARPGAVVARSILMQEIWDRRAGEHALDSVVTRLRAKLDPVGVEIVTVYRRGYRLIADDDDRDADGIRAVPG